MAELVQILDSYTEAARPKLMEQYKPGKAPKLNMLLEATGAQKDDLEAALFSIQSGMYLSSAVGPQLDMIGALFKVARNGATDADYRLAIQLVASMRSFSTPEDIISVLKGIYGAAYVEYRPEYPAGCVVFTDIAVPPGVLDMLAPAGVQVRGPNFLVDYEGNNIVDYDGNFLYGVS